jgi:uncharacterized membrane protein (UPF0127 family)
MPYGFWILFFGCLMSHLNKETAACEVIRHRMARLIGLAWRKALSVDVGLSAFE